MTRDLPDEVTTHVVLEWAMKQARHLSPHQHHVLLHLVINAWRYEPNKEGVMAGTVLGGRSSVPSISLYTGISQATVRRCLRALQESCYLHADMNHGNGQNVIQVFWTEQADELRQNIRDGVAKRPKEFAWPEPKKRLKVVEEATIIAFPMASK